MSGETGPETSNVTMPSEHLATGGSTEPDVLAERYLGLLAGCLTRCLFPERYHELMPRVRAKAMAVDLVSRLLAPSRLALVRVLGGDTAARSAGADWPAEAETMIGLKRLDLLRTAIREIVEKEIEGDVIECGVWRGGASIFMRAALDVYGDAARRVFVADSFQGLPPPQPEKWPQDYGDPHHTWQVLAVSLEEVKANFARYELLDDRVVFVPGWFEDTLPALEPGPLSLLRLDGDMYGSTMTALEALYDRVSPGGFVVIDDYGAVVACRAAVDDFRAARGITTPVEEIDWTGVFWRKEA